MYKDIFAVLAADKAESLRIVKPLHCSLFHCVVPVFLNFPAEKIGCCLEWVTRWRTSSKSLSFKLSLIDIRCLPSAKRCKKTRIAQKPSNWALRGGGHS